MRRSVLMAIGATVLATVGLTAFAPGGETQQMKMIQMYKGAACGCCSLWGDHLGTEGFHVMTKEVTDLAERKNAMGVPMDLRSCHTALVEGYVVEGHVPAADIQRMLEEKPEIVGIAVAGMPLGSPGMEEGGTETEPYEVIAFDKDGNRTVFARH